MDSLTTDRFVVRSGTLDDLPAMVDMCNIYSRELLGHDEFTLSSYRNEWTDPYLDLANDTRIMQLHDGQIIGCMEVWNTPPYNTSWLWGCVHPDFRNQGIGTVLMDWAEDRARAALERAPADVRITLETGAFSNDIPAIKLFEQRGFAVVRHILKMTRRLDDIIPTPQWPIGIRVRTMQPGDELAIYRANNEAFRDHWGHTEVAEAIDFPNWQHRKFNDPNFDPTLWFLALDGDEIAGIALGIPAEDGQPDTGWVNNVGVRRPWRRRGIAEALLYTSFAEFQRRGRHSVSLAVDASSLTGATRLYEKVGMRVTEDFVRFERELRAGVELATQTLAD